VKKGNFQKSENKKFSLEIIPVKTYNSWN